MKRYSRDVVRAKALQYVRTGVPFLCFIFFYLAMFSVLEHMIRLHYTVIHTALDDMIPFCEIFVVPYLSWFPFMIFNCAYFFLFDQETYRKVVPMLTFGMSLFLVVSALFPNIQYLRPAIMPRDNVFTHMVASLYRTDTPTNICPSIHVYNTVCLLMGLYMGHEKLSRSKIYVAFTTVLGILIILSTMLIKQHSVLDVTAGFLLAGVAYLVFARPDLLPLRRRSRRTAMD